MTETPQGREAQPLGPEPDPQMRSLAAFWAPKYWPSWLLLAWMRFLAAIPFRWMVALQGTIGRFGGRLMRSQRRVARRNLELCFPDLNAREIDRLLDAHFAALGICVGEMSVAWFGDVERFRARFRVEGLEHLQAALEQGSGVILYTGHFTPFEICTPVLKTLMPRFAFMYSRRRNELLDEIQRRKRERTGHESFARDNVRAMLASLSRNAVVWYAPDQAYHGRSSALIPFFGEPAMTNIATSKLARFSRATVVPFSYRRLPDSSGYVLSFFAPLEQFPTEDPVADTERLVAALEVFIRACPEQYLWTHRKFKGRPAPLPDAYAAQTEV
jgi:KDO2-lipid IV(A) lauroyltransferase